MANRDFKDVQALNREMKIISGKISLNSSAAVTGVTGVGFSASKTGTGVYRITLEDKYNALVGGAVSLLKAAAAALFVEITAQDVGGSTPYVDIRTINGSGVATDTAAAIDIYFSLNLRNTELAR